MKMNNQELRIDLNNFNFKTLKCPSLLYISNVDEANYWVKKKTPGEFVYGYFIGFQAN